MSSPLPATPTVSPLDAARQAIELTRGRLFPFRFDRWIALGFVAFLDQCGRAGGGSGGARFRGDPLPGVPGLPRWPGPDLPSWPGFDLGLTLAVASVVLVVVAALLALVLWVNSRGIFMYLDDVATGRSDVVRPWREHAELAQSLWIWRLGLALATLGGLSLLAALGALLYALARRQLLTPGTALAAGLVGLVPLALLLLLAAGLVSLALRDFVAPIQLARRISCGEALPLALELVRANAGPLAVYVLLKIAFTVLLVMAALVLGCGTCCLGFLPVVAQTILQPALYFERAWSLELLRGLGYDLFPEPVAPPPGPPPPPVPPPAVAG